MVVLSLNNEMGVEDLPLEIRGDSAVVNEDPVQGKEVVEEPLQTLDEMEKRMIADVLEKCGGNKSLAAEKLGISRSALYVKLKGLEK